MKLSPADEKLLNGVHPDLIRVVRRAAELATAQRINFKVIEGVRTMKRQRELWEKGATQTLKSRHIPGTSASETGYGHAVDIVPLLGGKISWAWPQYYPLADIIKKAAKLESVPIEWGGDWKSFKDGPHWQLPWSKYP